MLRSHVKPTQFSLRSILGVIAAVATALALPRWIGPAPTGFFVGAVVSIYLLWQFRTRGFLAGVLLAWVSFSLGMQMQLAIYHADPNIPVTAGMSRMASGEIAGIWLAGLILAFTYLAPIYLGRAVFDFYRIRYRFPRHGR